MYIGVLFSFTPTVNFSCLYLGLCVQFAAYLLGIGAPVHGIDLGKVTPQRFSGFHLNPPDHGQPRRCFLQRGVLHRLPSRLQSSQHTTG